METEQLLLDLGIEDDDLEEKIFQHWSEQTGVSVEELRRAESHRQNVRELRGYKPSPPFQKPRNTKELRYADTYSSIGYIPTPSSRVVWDNTIHPHGIDIEATLRKAYPSDFDEDGKRKVRKKARKKWWEDE